MKENKQDMKDLEKIEAGRGKNRKNWKKDSRQKDISCLLFLL